VQLWSLLCRWR